MFTLRFSTKNAAFQDGARNCEIGRILRQLAERIEAGGIDEGETRLLFDANGNTIGQVTR